MRMRELIGSTLILMMAACSKPGASSLHEESPAPFVSFVYNFSTNPEDIQRAANLFGLTEGGQARSCVSCHPKFSGYDGLSQLTEASHMAASCFQEDYRGQEAAFKALSCLARRAEGKTDAPAQLTLMSVEELKAALPKLRAKDLGILSAGLSHKAIVGIFKDAGMEEAHAGVLKKVGMPYRAAAMEERDFEILLSAILMDSFNDRRYIRYEGPDICKAESETFIGEKVKEHVRRMSEEGEGWKFVNMARGVPMFACSGTDASDCFNQQKDGQAIFPEHQDWLVPGVAGKVRELYTFAQETSFWTRSSADGRYVAAGGFSSSEGGAGSSIIDLMPLLQNQAAKHIAVKADFDPSFTPDNQAFMFQGEFAGSRICRQDVLMQKDLVTLDFVQEGCSKQDLSIGLYQAIGNDLVSGEIVTANGNFQGDSGAERYRHEAPTFGKSSTVEVTTIKRTQDGFEKVSSVKIPTPYEANWMMSPSLKLSVSEVSAATDGTPRHGGYHIVLTDKLRETNALPPLGDATSASLCTGHGEKATFSFDERYLVYYAYEKHDGEVMPADSSADLYVVDLLGDGKARRITQMPKGLYAQFPHFRSDGWLYFTVFDSKAQKRYVMATDAVGVESAKKD